MDSSDDDIPLARLCQKGPVNSTKRNPKTTPTHHNQASTSAEYVSACSTDSEEYMSSSSEFSPDLCEVQHCKRNANSECERCDMQLCVLHEQNRSCIRKHKNTKVDMVGNKQTIKDKDTISDILEQMINTVVSQEISRWIRQTL